MKLNNTLYLASILSCSLAISSGICSAEQVQLSLDESISMALADDASIESADAQREAADHALKAAIRNKGLIVSGNSQSYKIGGRNYESAYDAHDA